MATKPLPFLADSPADVTARRGHLGNPVETGIAAAHALAADPAAGAAPSEHVSPSISGSAVTSMTVIRAAPFRGHLSLTPQPRTASFPHGRGCRGRGVAGNYLFRLSAPVD